MNLVALARSLAQRKAEPEVERGRALAPQTAASVPQIRIRTAPRRGRRRLLGFLVMVILPTLAAAAYYGGIASDRYVSQSKLVLSTEGGGAGLQGELLNLIGAGKTDSAPSQAAMLFEFIRSPEMVRRLDSMIDLRNLWGRMEVDPLSRLPADATREELLDYYLDHVHVTAEPGHPILDVKTEAFSAPDAQLLLNTLVIISEEAVNRVFTNMRSDALAFAREELQRAEDRLAAAQTRLSAFRNQHGELDPLQAASALGAIASGLQSQLSTEKAKLEAMLHQMRPESPQVRAQKALIAGLEKQIAEDRSVLAGTPKSVYADLLGEWEGLLIEHKFAETAYTSAMAFLETTRADTLRQHSYVIDFVPPTLPEEATEPQRIRNTIVVFLGSLLTWIILSLVVSTMREHTRY